jgi:hypothetical protein
MRPVQLKRCTQSDFQKLPVEVYVDKGVRVVYCLKLAHGRQKGMSYSG